MIFSAAAVNITAASADNTIAEVGCGFGIIYSERLYDAKGYISADTIYTYESRMALKVIVDEYEENPPCDDSFEEAYYSLDDGIDRLVRIKNYIIGNVIATDDLNIKDATAIQKHVASLISFDKFQLKLADTDGNNAVNVKDATVLQKHIAGMKVDSLIGQVPKEPDPLPDFDDPCVVIGGNAYYVHEGDTITYVAYLQADKLFENIQAVISYDSEALELKRIYSDDPDIATWEVEGPERCPNLDGVFFNADLENEIRFNASKISGYNFKEEKVLVELEFVVKGAECSEISMDIEYITIKGDGSEKYFYKGEPVITDGISIYETALFYHIHENCPNEYLQ